MKPKFSPLMPLAACAALVVGLAACGGSDDTPAATAPQRAAGLVTAAPTTATDATGRQTLSVVVLTADGQKTLTTGAVSADTATTLKTSLVAGNLIDWIPSSTSTDTVVVDPDPARTFNVILSKGSSAAAQFDMAKYGPEVGPRDGTPGPMVAAGWVYNKATNSITVGDGGNITADMAGRAYAAPIRRYEETFAVAPNVRVFNVNTADYSKSTAADFASIPVTANYDYRTTARQAAYFLFDKNYTQAADAKVVAIWYFTPQSTADGKPVWDVPTQSPLLADKGTDPVSGQTYVSINATGVSAAPYTRSTEPFEMIKGTMYYVGDNEVASYILKADMGTATTADDRIIKIDAGWNNSGYQYWKNLELVGIDPRTVTDLWLTHAHGDHYGTAVEQLRMADNAGQNLTLWGSREDVNGISADQQGNAWAIAATLPASETVLRTRTTRFYEYDKWYDYGNVQIMVIWSPGHTTGATNMLFKVKNPTDGKFYTFGYHGGYGVNGLETPTAANGWRRLAWQHGFSYLQNNIDADFVSPQHTNQYPIVEVFQALKAYNRNPANASRQLTMLDAMGTRVYDSPVIAGQKVQTEFTNQLEKRRSVITYKATDAAVSSRRSIETSGPFKPGRENGLTAVAAKLLDGGKIIQGFVGAQNKNPAIPLLANGIVIPTDSYADDPGGYFVQVKIDVQDPAYKGFLPQGFTQRSPGMNATITYQGGPIETTNTEKATFRPPEYLRTQRLATLAEAQRVLATIAKDKAVTISLTPASEIVVPADVSQTFR